jgi:hypothetical protein
MPTYDNVDGLILSESRFNLALGKFSPFGL